jgi:hypothetical protein
VLSRDGLIDAARYLRAFQQRVGLAHLSGLPPRFGYEFILMTLDKVAADCGNGSHARVKVQLIKPHRCTGHHHFAAAGLPSAV